VSKTCTPSISLVWASVPAKNSTRRSTRRALRVRSVVGHCDRSERDGAHKPVPHPSPGGRIRRSLRTENHSTATGEYARYPIIHRGTVGGAVGSASRPGTNKFPIPSIKINSRALARAVKSTAQLSRWAS
jgi:hypothetical protein